MVVPTSFRKKETRLRARSLGWTLKSISLMIWLLNPRKDKKEPRIRKISRRKKCVDNCEEWGHLAKNYWYNKDKGATKGKDDEGEKLAHQNSDDSEGMILMVVFTYDHVDSKIWFLDTGCSNHMIGRREWLLYFDESKKSKVRLPKYSSLQVKGIGNIIIQRSNWEKYMIKYVPGMKCDLLSVRQLVEKVFLVVMKNGALELSTPIIIWC